MNELVVKIEDLSIPARETLRIISMYLDIVSPPNCEIALYSHHWDDLEKSIVYHSDGESLITHTFRGIRINSVPFKED